MIGLPDRSRLLADGKMGRAFVVIFDAVVDAFFFDAIQHGFKFANIDHIAIDAHQALRAKLSRFGVGVSDIGVEGDFRRVQCTPCAALQRDQSQVLWAYCS